ncbi:MULTISPECIES: hypothetical protein [unclassified Streptomyces]
MDRYAEQDGADGAHPARQDDQALRSQEPGSHRVRGLEAGY